MAIITKDDLKSYLKLDTTSTAEDGMLDHLIAAAISEMEQAHGRIYEYGDHTETFYSPVEGVLFLSAFPVLSITSVTVDETAVSASAYELDAKRGLLRGLFPAGWKKIEVQYKGGYWTDAGTTPPAGVPRLPAAMKQECLERAAYLYQNRRGIR
ncbi:hypothetical protein [Laceyella putida]|uniref:Phage gp6-like head-tail connector protein n=2 Tax=Laceyella putida TaxID=110101 RepID=A0ABW2RQZ8_9BACL